MTEGPAGDRSGGRSVSRRRSLRTVGAAATAIVGLAAGCTGAVPIVGENDGSQLRLPAAEPPTYRDWLPAAEAVSLSGSGPSPMAVPIVTTPSRAGSDLIGRPLGVARQIVGPAIDYFGIGIERYDLAIWDGPSAALAGPIDPETVATTVLESGYERAGTYRGYDRFERSDVPRTVAVTDGRLAWARGSDHRERVHALVDAREGHVERRHEASEAYAALTDRVGLRPYVTPTDGPTGYLQDHSVASAEGMDVDGDAGYRFVIARIASDADVSRAEIADGLGGNYFREEPIEQSVRVEDRFVTIAQRLSYDDTWGPVELAPPQVTWGVRERSDTIELRHEAGEPVETSRLSVRDLDGESVAAGISPNRTLSPGDVLELAPAVRRAGGFSLLWEGPDRRGSLLFEYEST